MSRHIAILLAAGAVTACSSDPPSAEMRAASVTPMAEYVPSPQPPADTFHHAPIPPPYAPAPPPPAPQYELAKACDVIVERTRTGVVLTAMANIDRPTPGEYSFVITKGGGGNSSDIEQGGPLPVSGGRAVELGSSEISLERGSSWRATLTLMSNGREICRRAVRS